MGGLKLNDTIGYNKKVNYYGKISKQFNQVVAKDEIFKGWYLPNWKDDEIWKKQHDRLVNQIGTTIDPKIKYPTPESFRDYCFEQAQKHKNIEESHGANDWFSQCGRELSWDKKRFT